MAVDDLNAGQEVTLRIYEMSVKLTIGTEQIINLVSASRDDVSVTLFVDEAA